MLNGLQSLQVCDANKLNSSFRDLAREPRSDNHFFQVAGSRKPSVQPAMQVGLIRESLCGAAPRGLVSEREDSVDVGFCPFSVQVVEIDAVHASESGEVVVAPIRWSLRFERL